MSNLRPLTPSYKYPFYESTHLWCKGVMFQGKEVMVQCGQCGEWKGQPEGLEPCDPTKLDGETTSCCECGEEYPQRDLIQGHIYCVVCREIPTLKERLR